MGGGPFFYACDGSTAALGRRSGLAGALDAVDGLASVQGLEGVQDGASDGPGWLHLPPLREAE